MTATHKFTGKWITSEEFCNLKPVNVFHRQLEECDINSVAPKNAHILFRKKFCANKNENTVIYISADDFYKLYINGRFVCEGPSAGYPFHYYYNKIDISEFIHAGENTIAVHTYYQGLINRVWVSGDDRHGLICDVEQDGKTLLASDETFLYSYHSGFAEMGIFGYDTQFAERYTSGTESENFQFPEYSDVAWKNAKINRHADWSLFEQETKMLEYEDIKPVSISKDSNGVTVDFGGIYVGRLYAQACGNAGEIVELLFGQELNDDGSVRFKVRACCDYKEEWVLSGNQDTLNEFDYKSFRYVRINTNAELKNIHLIARHYPFELNAKPNTSDEKLMSVWNLCVNSLKYGIQEVIQDCMEREKGFYLGDGCMTALAHAVVTKDTSILKRLADEAFRSSFINDGLVTCMCCSLMQEIAEYPLYLPYILYSYYKLTGDKEYLCQKYDDLCIVLDFYRERYMRDDGLLTNLDKWCVVEWPENYRDGYDADLTQGKICTDVHNVINASYIGAVKYANKISVLIGKDKYFNEETIVGTYINAFFDKEKGLFRDNVGSDHISVPSNAFAFMYGLFPDEESENNAVAYFEEKGITSVNFFSSYAILCGLKRIGRQDLIFKFLSDEKAWINMLKEGATRTFEGWGKESKWNTSLFHLTLSYPVIFLSDWDK